MLSAAKFFGFLLVLLAAPFAFGDGEKLEPGLTLSFGSDARTARLVDLYVPAATAPTPFTTPGRFTATWDGFLNLDIRDDYTFSAEGRGALKLTVDDEVALETSGDDLAKTVGKSIRIKKGPHHLVARYECPEKGDAWVRLFWSGSEFSREPMSPLVFTHTVKPARLREGRELIAALRCLKRHAPDASIDLKSPAMPDLVADAPSLNDVGARLNQDWMARWIANPRALRPQAMIPKMFAHAEAEKNGADIAAYLAKLSNRRVGEGHDDPPT